MATLTRHVRLLYLLALFQLVGGPIVLGGLMMVTRLMADREMTLSQSVSHTVDQLDDELIQSEAGEWIWTQHEGLLPPAKPTLPLPKKLKESKDKLWAVNDFGSLAWLGVEPLQIPESDWQDPVPRWLAYGPPLPPPRLG